METPPGRHRPSPDTDTSSSSDEELSEGRYRVLALEHGLGTPILRLHAVQELAGCLQAAYSKRSSKVGFCLCV